MARASADPKNTDALVAKEPCMPVSRSQFNEELGRIHDDLLSMSCRVTEDLSKAVEALRRNDAELAASVRADDPNVNSMQLALQDMAAVLIATQQPVAGDMRELVAVIRLADHLERIGDYASHLAKTVIKMGGDSWPRQFEILSHIGDIEGRMISDMMKSFLEKDERAARECAALDASVDQQHHVLVAMTLESLKANPERADSAVRLIRTSGFMERLGDHVTNCCELVIYMVTGEHAELND
jgi:phosphate transport system protein